MEISDPDFIIPIAIVIGCLMLALVTHRLTRPRNKTITVPNMPEQASGLQDRNASTAPAPTAMTNGVAPAAAAAVPHSSVAAAPAPAAQQLQGWHNSYGPAIQAWIQNHEALLDEITDGGLDVQSVSPVLTDRHEQLAPVIKDAIEQHPAPDMRAQLSALIVASQATLHALHRHQYDSAERQHLTYLDYRDPWLHRLRQFSATDSNSNEIRNLAHQHRDAQAWQ